MRPSRPTVIAALAALVISGLTVLLGSPAQAAPLAFPGAEGYGTTTAGGRGGTICQVTNLNDSGTGSFRACATMSGPRVVIFRTGGTINLQSRINILNPNMTVLGQTAPGDGITLRMAPGSNTDAGTIQIETHDIVIRYLRTRPGNPDGAADDSHDGIQIYKAGVNNVVIDHASVSWAVDENVNTYDYSDNITVSWSIISEALSNSTHPQGEHSKGMLSGGVDAHNVSIHHNLFASNVDRNPQISGVSTADVRNNVLYNYGDGSGDGTTLISSSKGVPKVNIVNNYYRKGPSSPANYDDWALYSGDNGCVHQVYVSGNKHNESGTTVTNATRGTGCDSTSAIGSAHPVPAVTTTTAEQAYTDVLAGAGASLVRDAVDTRIVSEVTNRTGGFKNSAGTYPTLATGTPPTDSDSDGLPDSWENGGGGTTPNGDQDGDGYTNIEEWAQSLLGGTPPPPTNTAPSVNAGTDQSITLPANANLDGTVSDPDAGDTLTSTWSKVSGPGTVTFGNANNVDTSAAFSSAGTYVLRLSTSDGTATTTDDVQITVAAQPQGNTAPVVSAGPDRAITTPGGASLDGTVSDDGQPNGTTTQSWSQVSGPGTTTFTDSTAVDTTATFSVEGTYVLRLTATDGSLSASDDMTVVVTAGQANGANPTAVRGSTACGVVQVNYSILADDSEPSDFEFNVMGDAQGTDTLTPPNDISDVWSYPSLPEDANGGSVDIDVQANGQWILHFVVDTDCQGSEPQIGGIQHVGQSFASSESGSVTVTKPNGLLDGDKVLIWVQENKGNISGATISAPGSVTAVGAEKDDGSSLGARVYQHTVSSTSPNSFTFTAGGSVSQMGAALVVYRGAGTVDLIDIDSEASDDATHPVAATTTAEALNVVFAGDRKYATGATPSTWTLGQGLSEHGEGQGPKSGSAFSMVIGDTVCHQVAGAKTYAATASQSTPYALTGLVQVQAAP